MFCIEGRSFSKPDFALSNVKIPRIVFPNKCFSVQSRAARKITDRSPFTLKSSLTKAPFSPQGGLNPRASVV